MKPSGNRFSDSKDTTASSKYEPPPFVLDFNLRPPTDRLFFRTLSSDHKSCSCESMNGPYQYWGCRVGTKESSIQCQSFDASVLWKVKNQKKQRLFKVTYSYNTYDKAGEKYFKKFVCCVTPLKVDNGLNSFIQNYTS